MDFKRGLLIGVVVGWLVEWAFDNLFWHRHAGRPAALLREGEGPQLQRLTAEGEVSRLQAELAENRQKLATTEHELKTAQAKLREAEQTIEQLRAELNPPVQAVAEPAKKERKDRLERIRGIGAVFARRLNEAGVFTFEQLAELSPDRIREILHVEEWQKIQPEKWIEEARELGRTTTNFENNEGSRGEGNLKN